jgi:hypothetical protein
MPIVPANQEQLNFIRLFQEWLGKDVNPLPSGEDIFYAEERKGPWPTPGEGYRALYDMLIPQNVADVGMEAATGALPSTAAIRAFQKLYDAAKRTPGERAVKDFMFDSLRGRGVEVPGESVRKVTDLSLEDLNRALKPDTSIAKHVPEQKGVVVGSGRSAGFETKSTDIAPTRSGDVTLSKKVRADDVLEIGERGAQRVRRVGPEVEAYDDLSLMNSSSLDDEITHAEKMAEKHEAYVAELQRLSDESVAVPRTASPPLEGPRKPTLDERTGFDAGDPPIGRRSADWKRLYGDEVAAKHAEAKSYQEWLASYAYPPNPNYAVASGDLTFGRRVGQEIPRNPVDPVTSARNQRMADELPVEGMSVQDHALRAMDYRQRAELARELKALGPDLHGRVKAIEAANKRREKTFVKIRQTIGPRGKQRDFTQVYPPSAADPDVLSMRRAMDDTEYIGAPRDLPKHGIKAGDPLAPKATDIPAYSGEGRHIAIPRSGIAPVEKYGKQRIYTPKTKDQAREWADDLRRSENARLEVEAADVDKQIADLQVVIDNSPTHLKGGWEEHMLRLKMAREDIGKSLVQHPEINIKRFGNE